MGNEAKAYVNQAIDKLKRFEKVFLKMIVKGEREKMRRIDKRCGSVSKEI